MRNYTITTDDEKIIRCTLRGAHSESDSKHIIKRINQIAKDEDTVMVLLDINELEIVTSGAKQNYINALTSNVEFAKKLAFLGSGLKVRVLANFMIRGLNLEEKVRYFEDEDEVIKWLQE